MTEEEQAEEKAYDQLQELLSLASRVKESGFYDLEDILDEVRSRLDA